MRGRPRGRTTESKLVGSGVNANDVFPAKDVGDNGIGLGPGENTASDTEGGFV